MEQILEILRLRREGFLVLSGDDAWTVALIGAGADGLISVASNEIPALMAEMVRAALEDDFATARALQTRLLPLLVGNFMESNPVPAKAAMVMLGILENDTVRPPLAPISASNREALRVILEDCGLLDDAT
jgi:4-hydroxy-tetrahydrodipicolinate synthase